MRLLHRKWFRLSIAFALGLVVGWLALGWGLWPRSAGDATPRDLAAGARDEYLKMVADSFAATGDIEQARTRLKEWPVDQLAQDLSGQVDRLATLEPDRAGSLRGLTESLGLSEEPIAAADADGTPFAAAVQITPTLELSAPGTPAVGSSPTPSATQPLGGTPVGTAGIKQPSSAPTPPSLDHTENILVLGMDTRPQMDAWRTDTIMIVAIDRDSGQVGIISIPRDLYVNIPGYGRDRINTADYVGEKNKLPGGGPELVGRVLQQTLGIPTQHYVRMKQEGLVKLVDSLGGVEVTLDCPLYEQTPDEHSPTGYSNFYLPAGKVQLDGITAKKFATYRHIQSDFGRARRQQQLIWAIRNRAMKGDVLPRLPELWAAMADTFSTDMGLLDIGRLASLGMGLKAKDIHAMNLGAEVVRDYTTPQGAQVLLLRDRSLVQARIAQLFDAKPLAEVNKAEPGKGCPTPPPGFPDLTPKPTPQPTVQ